MLQGLHFWWIWSLKVPFGQGLQEPEHRIGLVSVPILDNSCHWLVETHDSPWAPGLCRTYQCKSCTCHCHTLTLLCSRTLCQTRGCILSARFELLDTAGRLWKRDSDKFQSRKCSLVNWVFCLTHTLRTPGALAVCRTFCVHVGPARGTKVLWLRSTLFEQAVSCDEQRRCTVIFFLSHSLQVKCVAGSSESTAGNQHVLKQHWQNQKEYPRLN